MAHQSRSAGKHADLSTDWSEWIWSEKDGYSYCTRYGPTGELEYDYFYPEETNPEETPRTVPTNWTQDTGEGAPPSSDRYTTDDPEDNSGEVGGSNWVPNYDQSTSVGSSRSTGQPNYSVAIPASRSYGVSTSKYNSGVGDMTQQMEATYLETVQEDLPLKYVEGPGGQVGTTRHITQSLDNDKLRDLYVEIDERKNKKFWKPGRVFMMLWTEPARSRNTQGSQYNTVWLGQQVFSEIRRFVVIGEGWGNVVCSPIHTYSGKATLKDNLPDPQQHAIIYTSSKPPAECCEKDSAGKIVREELIKDPIRVVSELAGPDGDLGTLSRINYAKLYTVEKYVRVLNIGKVHDDSMDSLLASCFFARPADEPPQGPRKSRHSSSSSSSSKPKERSEKRDDRDKGQSSRSGRRKGGH